MPQRFLRPGITNSERYNAVPVEAQNLFIPRLLSLVDDYGRFDGRASVIWGHAYSVWNEQNPSEPVTLAHVDQMLEQLAKAKLIVVYRQSAKTVLQFLQWRERIRAGVKEKWPGLTHESKLLQSFGDLQQVLRELLPSSSSSASSPTSSSDGEFSLTGEESAVIKKAKNETDEEWLKSLETNPAYEGIDVPRQFSKCKVWCENNGCKPPSRQRFINWLNRVEKPMQASGSQQSQAATPYALKMQLEALESQIAEVKRRGFEDAFGLQFKPEDAALLRELKAKRAEVVSKIGKLT